MKLVKKTFRVLTHSTLASLIFTTSGLCVFDQKGTGARALSLGGAFTAAVNDVASIQWNPSALTTLESKELEFMYTDLYSKGLVSFSNLSFGYPDLGPGGFGISWTRLGVTNKVPFEYSEHTYTIAYGMKIHNKLSAGTSLNYFKLNSAIKGSAFGLHIGLHYRPFKIFSLGGVYENAVRTPLRYESGLVETLPQNFKAGGSVSFGPAQFLLDADKLLDKKPLLSSGIEIFMLKNSFSLRGGLSQRNANGFNWLYTLGLGMRLRSLGLDYTYENHFDLGMSHIVSVKWKF